MPKIGILYGMENTFPSACVERINDSKNAGIHAESIRVGGVKVAEPCEYAAILDRISHDVDFYRAFLKNAVLTGTSVLNDPFRASANDKFLHASQAKVLGIPVPNTVIIPQKSHPPGTNVQSMRNLMFPLNWDEVFEYVGFPAYLKPLGRGAWMSVQRVESREAFFPSYDQTGSTCMLLQSSLPFEAHYRCYVVGKHTRVLQYEPTHTQNRRYASEKAVPTKIEEKLAEDAKHLCGVLGYDINAVDFGYLDGKCYLIDSFNPAPDADIHTLGHANFEWLVDTAAKLLIEEAQRGRKAKAAPAASEAGIL